MKLQYSLLIIYILSIASIFLKETTCDRLSPQVIPTHYSIKIQPFIDNSTFIGEVAIYIRLKTHQSQIVLNSAKLDIDKVNFNEERVGFEICEKKQELILNNCGCKPFQPGEHRLFIKFKGSLVPEKMEGGLTRQNTTSGSDYIVISDYEPHYARKTFPCFDQPFFKSRFNIRVVTPNETYIALSNMEQIQKFVTPAGVIYDFATSVPMSTYLISFAITSYTYAEQIFVDGTRHIPVRIYTNNASKENNGEALNQVVKALQYYTNYTGISYPLNKLDLIEYERTQRSIATENWGLITFQVGVLSENTQKAYDNITIANILFHEISHYWFGNLVTNEWWNDLWLQEAFATFFSYKAITAEGVNKRERFLTDFEDLIIGDCKKKKNPVVQNANMLKDVNLMFNDIVYQKGESILFMVENLVGEEIFQQIVRKFLRTYAYTTATTNDFIATVESIAPRANVRPLLESFLYQSSFPLVSVEKDPHNNLSYILRQSSCYQDKLIPSKSKWSFPITYVTDTDNETETIWFDRDMDEVILNTTTGNKWIVFNVNYNDLYRVKYSDELWNSISENIEDFSKSEYDLLITEANLLYETGYKNCDYIFKLMENAPGKWNIHALARFHISIVDFLHCHKREYELYMNFLKLFDKNLILRELSTETSKCEKSEHESKIDSADKEKALKCIKWIGTNLEDYIGLGKMVNVSQVN